MHITSGHERVALVARIETADRTRLEELARKRDRSLSAEIRCAIREHLERECEIA